MDVRSWLLVIVVLVACAWIPYVLDRFFRVGIGGVLGSPTPENAAKQSAWALRAKAAHANAVENLVVFAPLALLAIPCAAGAGIATTASAVYCGARIVHYVSYAADVSGVRTVAFIAGFGAQIALAFVIAGAA